MIICNDDKVEKMLQEYRQKLEQLEQNEKQYQKVFADYKKVAEGYTIMLNKYHQGIYNYLGYTSVAWVALSSFVIIQWLFRRE